MKVYLAEIKSLEETMSEVALVATKSTCANVDDEDTSATGQRAKQ